MNAFLYLNDSARTELDGGVADTWGVVRGRAMFRCSGDRILPPHNETKSHSTSRLHATLVPPMLVPPTLGLVWQISGRYRPSCVRARPDLTSLDHFPADFDQIWAGLVASLGVALSALVVWWFLCGRRGGGDTSPCFGWVLTKLGQQAWATSIQHLCQFGYCVDPYWAGFVQFPTRFGKCHTGIELSWVCFGQPRAGVVQILKACLPCKSLAISVSCNKHGSGNVGRSKVQDHTTKKGLTDTA